MAPKRKMEGEGEQGEPAGGQVGRAGRRACAAWPPALRCRLHVGSCLRPQQGQAQPFACLRAAAAPEGNADAIGRRTRALTAAAAAAALVGPQAVKQPRKALYRMRAHSNPLNDASFPVPLRPEEFDWCGASRRGLAPLHWRLPAAAPLCGCFDAAPRSLGTRSSAALGSN